MKFINGFTAKIVLLFIFFLLGCGSRGESVNQDLIQDLKNLTAFDSKKHKVVLIMPSSGCSGCIAAVEEFVRDNKFPSLFLILTNSVSQKDAVYRLNLVNPLCDYFWDSNKTFYDSKDSEAIYPKIVYWNDGDWLNSRVVIVKPENPNAMVELWDYLINLKF